MKHQDAILELRDVSKSFPGIKALDAVSVRFRRGTIHALVGENGAGKSTLMKILIGLYPKYEGAIFLRGRRIAHNGVRQALDAGVSMIHQELMYVPHMTIAENLLLGKEPVSRFLRRVDRKRAARQTERLLQQVGMALDPNRLMRDLRVAEQQMVEIAKAISYDAEIIIMDEPTSAISEREVKRLFDIIADLKDRGVTIIYISHKLDEVLQIADEVTVLRDGRVIGTHPIDQVDADRLIAAMVGRKMGEVFPKRAGPLGSDILTVRNLTKKGIFRNVSFSLRRGEILGLAGLMGAGRTVIIRCIFGLDKYDRGQILIDGKEVAIRSPADALKLGLGLVSEDRQITGLVPCLSLGANITLPHLHRCSWGPVIQPIREQKLIERMVGDLAVKSAGSRQRVAHLSGGNQQKAVLARALLGRPDILMLDEPTRGIDVGTKSEIYELMRRLADEGKAIIMASSELPEILGMSDRILVLNKGIVTGHLHRGQANPEAVMRFAMADQV